MTITRSMLLIGITCCLVTSLAGGVQAEGPPPGEGEPDRKGDANTFQIDELERARRDPVVISVRRSIGRGIASNDPERRRQAKLLLLSTLEKHKDQLALTVELLDLQARLQLANDDLQGMRNTVERQHAILKRAIGPAPFMKWLSSQERRLLEMGAFQLARSHLEHAIHNETSPAIAAMLDLRIGARLAGQRRFDEAKAHYLGIVDRHPTVGNQAILRAAQIATQQNMMDEAERLYEGVISRGPSKSEDVEDARHTLKVIRQGRPNGGD